MIKSFSFTKVLFITFVFSFFFFVNLGNAQTSTTTNTTSTTTSMTATSTGSTATSTGTTTGGTTTATTTGTTAVGTTATTTGSVTITPPISTPQVTVTSITNIPLCEIQRSLRTGSSGEDVRCLQRFLNFSGFKISETGIGSMGNETTYFGPKTASAVARWQNSNSASLLLPAGLSVGTGNFGPLSFNYYVSIVRRAFGLN